MTLLLMFSKANAITIVQVEEDQVKLKYLTIAMVTLRGLAKST